MITIKSYTDIHQSKKLAEILPTESADMAWCNNFIKGIDYADKYSANLYAVKEMKETFDKELAGWDKYWKLIPCWSLAALLSVFPNGYVIVKNYHSFYFVESRDHEKSTNIFNNSIDACVEMILKLHEQNLL